MAMLVNRQPAGDHSFTRQAPCRLYLKWCQKLDKSYILLVTPKKVTFSSCLDCFSCFRLLTLLYICIFKCLQGCCEVAIYTHKELSTVGRYLGSRGDVLLPLPAGSNWRAVGRTGAGSPCGSLPPPTSLHPRMPPSPLTPSHLFSLDPLFPGCQPQGPQLKRAHSVLYILHVLDQQSQGVSVA